MIEAVAHAAMPVQASPVGAVVAPRRRICIVSEDLSGPPDEGVKKFTLALAAALEASNHVTLVSLQERAQRSVGRLALSSRTFLSAALRRQLRSARPEIIVYAARPSTTFWSFLRSRVLSLLCPRATVVLLGLQT